LPEGVSTLSWRYAFRQHSLKYVQPPTVRQCAGHAARIRVAKRTLRRPTNGGGYGSRRGRCSRGCEARACKEAVAACQVWLGMCGRKACRAGWCACQGSLGAPGARVVVCWRCPAGKDGMEERVPSRRVLSQNRSKPPTRRVAVVARPAVTTIVPEFAFRQRGIKARPRQKLSGMNVAQSSAGAATPRLFRQLACPGVRRPQQTRRVRPPSVPTVLHVARRV